MERNPQCLKIGVGIPTLNRYDLLKPNLVAYSKDFVDVPFYILDNGNQGINFKNIITYTKNIGVGASWNVLCNKIFETCDYALILNDDIYLGKNINQINALIQKKGDMLMRATPDWCAFIIPKYIFNKVGIFDEIFYPAYYEDKSYEYRMKLMGIPILKTPDLNPFIYQNCKTQEKDYSIIESAKRNKMIYIQMWGGEPEMEKYKYAYNQ